MTTAQKRFLIVDDDPHNNILTKIVLKKILGEVLVQDFVAPEKGLEYIRSESSRNPEGEKTVLLLDINMPNITGWEFLDIFETMDDRTKSQYDIYILSSSIDPRDIKKAKENPLVIDFIEKPLGVNMMLKLFA